MILVRFPICGGGPAFPPPFPVRQPCPDRTGLANPLWVQSGFAIPMDSYSPLPPRGVQPILLLCCSPLAPVDSSKAASPGGGPPARRTAECTAAPRRSSIVIYSPVDGERETLARRRKVELVQKSFHTCSRAARDMVRQPYLLGCMLRHMALDLGFPKTVSNRPERAF